MGMSEEYQRFLESKMQLSGEHGFAPVWMPGAAFDFQEYLLDWACCKGRSAIFADCGTGKTLLQLAWAENVVRHTNGRVLILTPLAVSAQTQREADKFGVDAWVSRDGHMRSRITITNYERLHYFDSSDFVGCVCDESSILKNFDGVRKAEITEFMRRMPYRLLCTATAAPNDYIELGTSSEALGELGFADVLSRFFKKTKKTYTRRDEHRGEVWRFRGHAERDFWRWVCSWARAMRKPSDLGFEDGDFILPPLTTVDHVVKARTLQDGCLFDMPAVGLQEQRQERRRTIQERCEMAASLVAGTDQPAVCWCHLNDEGDLLTRLVPDAEQVAGRHSDDKKEETLEAFANGDVRVLVTKPTIAGFGLNWQHCAHQTFFPSHSFEQWYQAVRRSWRFGQEREVVVDVVSSEGEVDVMDNLKRKQENADAMFDSLVSMMQDSLSIAIEPYNGKELEAPAWL
jgi:hypothetical protein